MFDRENFDIDGCFDKTTSTFVARRSGIDRLNASAQIESPTVGTRTLLALRRNGLPDVMFAKEYPDGSGAYPLSGSCLVKATQGDEFSVVFHHTDSTIRSIESYGPWGTWFTGEFVGKPG